MQPLAELRKTSSRAWMKSSPVVRANGNAKVATVLRSIPVSSNAEEFLGRLMKQ
jgi:hypothetical protein